MTITNGAFLNLTQHGSLAPALQQSASILRMTMVELAEYLQKEIEANPFVELNAPERAPDLSFPRNATAQNGDVSALDFARTPMTLGQSLLEQLGFIRLSATERPLAEWLIGMLDDDGYLRDDPNDLASMINVSPRLLIDVLARLKCLEPAGIFAKDLPECLLLQVKAQGNLEPGMEALITSFRQSASFDPAALAKISGLPVERVRELLSQLRGLNPKPAANLTSGHIDAIQPDVFLQTLADGSWRISVNEQLLPRIVLASGYYATTLSAIKSEEARTFAKENYSRAAWLVECVRRRSETLLRVSECLVRRQPGFIVGGALSLIPLTLKQVADELGLHLSTISRVTSTKFMSTPKGTISLREFFARTVGSDVTEAITSHTVKQRIGEIIEGESGMSPLPDYQIQGRLSSFGITISRRTVTKYREQLGIPSCRNRGPHAVLGAEVC